MDLWIVAAAAGAGYAAKVNILKNSTSRTLTTCSCDHSQPRNLLQQIRNRTCPFCRLAKIKTAATSIIGEAQNDLLEYTTTEEVGSSQRLLKSSSQLKKRSNGYNILKPVNFSESWLTSELYAAEDYACRLEDYAYSSPSTDKEKALTIGSLISRRSHEFRKDMELEEQTEASQGFSNNDLLHFFVGIAIGMMLVIAYYRREVEYLNQVLKKNENLVHDLYQELEMNDHSTLKELANDNINEHSLKQEWKNSTKFDGKAKNSEAMSKIEAELEAELERLELTMKSSTLGRSFDFIQEDFGQDRVDGEVDTLSDSEHEASRSSSDQTETGIYDVSPQELSLRLHEVIQERLTARIIELEAALEDSQKRLESV